MKQVLKGRERFMYNSEVVLDSVHNNLDSYTDFNNILLA